jgi:hypothetical protein
MLNGVADHSRHGSFIDRKTLFSYSEALFACWGEWDRISGRCSLGVVG